MTRPTRLHIDLSAIQSNLKRIQALAPNAKVTAMIKANAYGHGLSNVAKALDDAHVDALGVASIDEALQCRAAGVHCDIRLMQGLFGQEELAAACEQDFSVVIHSAAQLDLIAGANDLSKPLRVWLKIDTGMHRLGLLPDVWADVFKRCQSLPDKMSVEGLMTHLADADYRDRDTTDKQLQLFESLVNGIDLPHSIANSAGILAWPKAIADWVRPGLILYGVSPFADKVGADFGLVPAMRFETQVIAVRQCQRGDAIGYGGRFVCPEDMLVAVAAVGYGDGYPRHAEDGTPVLVNGHRLPLVGNVSMDMITIDCRQYPEVAVGDTVQLWGPELPVEQVARCASTIPYELLCAVAGRVLVARY
jgi:alanine racemase